MELEAVGTVPPPRFATWEGGRAAPLSGVATLPGKLWSSAGAAQAGTACVAGVLAMAVVARVTRRIACSGRRGRAAVVSRPAQEGEFNIPGVMYTPNNRPSAREQKGGDWLFPENYQEDDGPARLPGEEPPKVTPPKAGYAVWICMKKKIPEIVKAWAEVDGATPEQQDALRRVADLDVPSDWACWAIADGTKLPAGGGFYMMGPTEPQAIVLLDAVSPLKNELQYVVCNPSEVGPGLTNAVREWIDSLKPKKSMIKRPTELALFGLEIGGGSAASAQISKGL